MYYIYETENYTSKRKKIMLIQGQTITIHFFVGLALTFVYLILYLLILYIYITLISLLYIANYRLI